MSLKFIRWLFRVLEKAAPNVGGHLACKVFFTPSRKKHGIKHAALLNEAEPLSIEVNNKKVVLHTWGTGPTILLIHGWSTNGLSFSAMIEPITKNGFKVVVPDMPSHGLSEGKKSSVYEFRDTIMHLLQLHPTCFAIIGHSLGGLASLMALNKRPHKVKVLITVGMPVVFDHVLNNFTNHVGAGVRTKRRLNEIIQKRYKNHDQPFITADLIFEPSKKLHWTIVHDLNDDEVTIADAEYLALKTGSRLMTTKGLGHIGLLYDQNTIGFLLEVLNTSKHSNPN